MAKRENRNVSIQKHAMNAGEISPRLFGRMDLAKYKNGLKTCLNAIPLPHGGVTNRPGFRFINYTKFANLKSRLIDFEFSESESYVLEFGDYYMRVFVDGGIVVHTTSSVSSWVTATSYSTTKPDFVKSGGIIYKCIITHTSGTFATDLAQGKWLETNVYEISTPYSAAEVFQLDWTQSADTLIVVHPSYRPRAFVRTAHNDWTDTGITFAWPCTLKTDYTGITLTPSGTTGSITLTASSAFFDPSHLSSQFLLHGGYVRVTSYTSSTVVVALVIETLSATTATTSWSEEIFSTYRGWPSKVTFFEDRLVFSSTPYKPLGVYASQTGDYYNFKIDSPVVASSAVKFNLQTSGKQNAIRWIVPGKKLFIGTTGSEGHMDGYGDEPIAHNSIIAREETPYGSKNIRPVKIGDTIMFVQRHGKVLREWRFFLELNSYLGKNASLLGEHLTFDYTLTDLAYQKSSSVLWAVRSDGALLGLTMMPEHDVYGWHRHLTDGVFESITVIPGQVEDELWASVARKINGSWIRFIERLDPMFLSDDPSDAFFVDSGLTYENSFVIESISKASTGVLTTVVNHDFSDGDEIYINGIIHGMTELNGVVLKIDNVSADTMELYHVDGVTPFSTSGFTSWSTDDVAAMVYRRADVMTNLDHLEGEEVAILADGAAHPNKVVTSGQLTLNNNASKVHIGLPIVSDIEMLNLESTASGETIQGRKKHVNALILKLFNTLGMKVGRDVDHLDVVPFRDSSIPLGSVKMFTGDVLIPFEGDWSYLTSILVRQDQPLPITVLSISASTELGG
jgi:hypothetical protein